jgi:UDP-N-acetylmuramate: L-alanyl-gamma-D-glutamyl-meso-diaminopimelate ligase
VHYQARIAVLTSVEFDHADIYADLDAVRRAFDMLVSGMPPDGVLIAWGDSPEVRARAKAAPCPVLYYGKGGDCQWRLLAAEPSEDGGAQLKVRTPEGRELGFYSPLAGEHNALNTMACMASLCAAGMSADQAAAVQRGFGGVKRRQEVRGIARGVLVVDDFAHHPTAVRETVSAIARFGVRGWRPGAGRLVAVFEPRTNTSKRDFFQDDYATAFGAADLVFLREPPGVEDVPEDERFSSSRLAEVLKVQGAAARSFADTDALLAALLQELRAGDLCLIMSNGGFDNIHQRLLAALST